MKKSHSLCALDVKNNDYYRYICSLFAPQNLRENLFILYAFNNEIAKIKDLISEPMIGYIRIAWWREALDEIYGNKIVRKHEIALALQELVIAKKLPREFLDKIIDARELELSSTSFTNFEDLQKHMDSTSTNLLLASLHVLGLKNNPAIVAVSHIGTAYALIGIMRATKWNAAKRHIMFPKDMLEKQNITEDDIAEGRNLQKTKIIVRELCDKVSINLQNARELRKTLPPEAMPVYLHTVIASCFLKRIIKNDYDLFNGDLESGKLRILIRMFFGAQFSK